VSNVSPEPRGFTQIPNALLDHPGIGNREKLVLIQILRCAYGKVVVEVGHRRLARRLGYSRETVRAAIESLVSSGLIVPQVNTHGKRERYALQLHRLAQVPESEPGLDGTARDAQGRFAQKAGLKNGPPSGPEIRPVSGLENRPPVAHKIGHVNNYKHSNKPNEDAVGGGPRTSGGPPTAGNQPRSTPRNFACEKAVEGHQTGHGSSQNQRTETSSHDACAVDPTKADTFRQSQTANARAEIRREVQKIIDLPLGTLAPWQLEVLGVYHGFVFAGADDFFRANTYGRRTATELKEELRGVDAVEWGALTVGEFISHCETVAQEIGGPWSDLFLVGNKFLLIHFEEIAHDGL
jgi:hypothetical protein